MDDNENGGDDDDDDGGFRWLLINPERLDKDVWGRCSRVSRLP